MSAEIIEIYATPKPTPYFKKRRFWLTLFDIADLGNNVALMPLMSSASGTNKLVLMFFNAAGQKSVRPQTGKWVNDILLETGLKLMPLAYSDCTESGDPGIFLEVVSVRKDAKLCLDIHKG